MKKIPTYFERDWNGDRSRVISEVNPACQWVADGEGVATQKIDGACCMIHRGRFFKRREIPDRRIIPAEFVIADADEQTGRLTGWMPVTNLPEDRYFREAFAMLVAPQDGTYELIGPKVQGNPEHASAHGLVAHNLALQFREQPPTDFNGLRAWMDGRDIEGVVWHHPDGRMAKLKLRDFGIKRPPAENTADSPSAASAGKDSA